MKKILLLLFSFVLMSGCELENKKNKAENENKNTIGNLENCIKRNSSDLVNEDVTKFNCISKLSKKVEDKLKGKAGPKNNYGDIKHSGYFENLSTDIIYSSVKIDFYHEVDYDEKNKDCRANSNCKVYVFSKVYDELWLQPGESESFSMELIEENLSEDVKIEPPLEIINFVTNDSDTSKKNWSWEIGEPKGFYLEK